MIEIELLELNDARFWPIVGPLCAYPSVREEIGWRISVLDGDRWYAAFIDGENAGAGCLRIHGVRAILSHAYVWPFMRHRGVHRELLTRRLSDASILGCVLAISHVSPAAVRAFEALGFVSKSKRGRFSVMTRAL